MGQGLRMPDHCRRYGSVPIAGMPGQPAVKRARGRDGGSRTEEGDHQMIRDEDLKSSIDYSEGQKEAAHRILMELVNIFQEYEDDTRIVGGWVPDLMFPGEGHNGYGKGPAFISDREITDRLHLLRSPLWSDACFGCHTDIE